MTSIITCDECGNRFRGEDASDCPACNPSTVAADKPSRVGKSESVKPKVKLSVETQAIVDSQNRTTHAVRSLATFLFISICSTAIGYGIVGAGAGVTTSCALSGEFCDGSSYVFGGWLVIVLGFFIALAVGISELNKSRVH